MAWFKSVKLPALAAGALLLAACAKTPAWQMGKMLQAGYHLKA